jgi:hypothetical protein
MQEERHIHGHSEDEIWQQVAADLAQEKFSLRYRAVIHQQAKEVLLDIDIDLGGGFESGFSTTTFSAPIPAQDEFYFALHREHFVDEIGKFFGMQDIEIGYPDFDTQVVVKSSNLSRIRSLFEDAAQRETLLSLGEFHFATIASNDQSPAQLELLVEDGIKDPTQLRILHHLFLNILCKLDSSTI